MVEPAIDLVNRSQSFIETNDTFCFEETYIRLRKKESRVYSDEELLRLPDIEATHPHYKEWKIRKKAAAKLRRYFERKNRSLTILEVGCGNGWLSRFLSSIPLSKITGTDINKTELLQAKRVFGHVPNLHFEFGGITTPALKDIRFDCIVFASSIQYFSSLREILLATAQLLKLDGEIHITDSPFYKEDQLNAAKERTNEHFRKMGFAEMAGYYFHHPLDELDGFDYSVLYKPGFTSSFLQMNKNPFPWICIKK